MYRRSQTDLDVLAGKQLLDGGTRRLKILEILLSKKKILRKSREKELNKKNLKKLKEN
jgi:hypothetical protein